MESKVCIIRLWFGCTHVTGRLCLNYKGLPYRTEWLEFPEIAPHCIKHGIPATSTKPDGTPYYTLPAIHDPSTGSYISDSFAIAIYLDATYPSTPPILPHGTQGLQASFESAFRQQVQGVWSTMWRSVLSYLNESSANHLGSRRMGEKTTRDFILSAEEEKIIREKAKEDLGKVHEWFSSASRSRNPGPFLMGSVVSWADFVVCSHFLCWKTILGADSKEWKDIEKWNEGQWAALLDNLEKYQGVR